MKHRTVLGVDAEVAETFAERAKGLIGRKSLAPGTGMLMTKCNCIHTFVMRFPIDATFLDREGKVVKVVRNIPPWRPWIWGGFKSVSVLETQMAREGVIEAKQEGLLDIGVRHAGL